MMFVLFMPEIPTSTLSRDIDFNFIVYICKILEELFDFALSQESLYSDGFICFQKFSQARTNEIYNVYSKLPHLSLPGAQ